MRKKLYHWFRAISLNCRSGGLVEQAAGEVARQCRAGLWRRVGHRTAAMSIAEVRGYARAHAAGLVAAEVEQTIERYQLQATWRDRIAEAAVSRLIAMVTHDVLAGEPPMARNLAA